MSVNGLVFNLVNDLKVTIKLGGRRNTPRPSVGQAARGFVALGLVVCVALIVLGLTIAGATSGIENEPPIIKTLVSGFIGAGLIPGLFLVLVYFLMGGGEKG